MKKILAILLSLILLSTQAWGGVDFNGDADYISISNPTLGTSITLYARFSADVNTKDMVAIGIANNADSDDHYALAMKPDNYFVFYHRSDDTSWTTYGSPTIGVSYSVFGTLNSTTSDTALFVDGVKTTGTLTGVPPLNTASIGGLLDSSPAYGDGTVSEVAIWDTILTDAEIDIITNSKLKRMPLQIQSGNLLHYWSLDDYPSGSGINGKTYNDMSGNDNTGTGTDANANSTNVSESVLSYP